MNIESRIPLSEALRRREYDKNFILTSQELIKKHSDNILGIFKEILKEYQNISINTFLDFICLILKQRRDEFKNVESKKWFDNKLNYSGFLLKCFEEDALDDYIVIDTVKSLRRLCANRKLKTGYRKKLSATLHSILKPLFETPISKKEIMKTQRELLKRNEKPLSKEKLEREKKFNKFLCYSMSKHNNKVSNRELARKFKVNKDTISNWINEVENWPEEEKKAVMNEFSTSKNLLDIDVLDLPQQNFVSITKIGYGLTPRGLYKTGRKLRPKIPYDKPE